MMGECKRVLFASLFNSTLNPFGLHPFNLLFTKLTQLYFMCLQ